MYVGIDYHKRYAVATSMDDKGQVVEQVRLQNKPEDLVGFVDRLPEDSKIAIEATRELVLLLRIIGGQKPGDPSCASAQDEGDSRSENKDRQDHRRSGFFQRWYWRSR